jgi:hypothetical protein
MSRQTSTLLVVTLALIGGTAGLLAQLSAHQKLGVAGVKTHAVPNSVRLQVDLPERVLDYQSEALEPDDLTLGTLPADTSFGQRAYSAPDGFGVVMNVVLMGTDRTSLHKPQFCLEGQGFHIDPAKSEETTVHVDKPVGYELPVVKLVANQEFTQEGQPRVRTGVYVYWYVADGALSASVSGFQRMWWMSKELMRTGVLQRWAYVSCFAVCAPGQEGVVFERMKTFITAAVPEFQLTPQAALASTQPQP